MFGNHVSRGLWNHAAGGWPLLVRPVVDLVSPWYSIPFLLYVVFAAGLAQREVNISRDRHF